MKKLLFILLFILPFAGICQTANQNVQLPDVMSFIKETSLLNKQIFLNFEKSTTNTNSIDAKELAEALAQLIGSKEIATDKAISNQRITALNAYYNSMGQFGSAMEGMFLTADDNIPFEFATYNGELAFCQNGIFAENTYNTADANADQRAVKVAGDLIIPGLANFKPLLAIPDLNYFCLAVAYTVHDFSSETSKDRDTETLAIILPSTIVQKYLNKQLSALEVLKASVMYNVNKNTGAELRKVSIQ